jgi:hypothetical protein
VICDFAIEGANYRYRSGNQTFTENWHLGFGDVHGRPIFDSPLAGSTPGII